MGCVDGVGDVGALLGAAVSQLCWHRSGPLSRNLKHTKPPFPPAGPPFSAPPFGWCPPLSDIPLPPLSNGFFPPPPLSPAPHAEERFIRISENEGFFGRPRRSSRKSRSHVEEIVAYCQPGSRVFVMNFAERWYSATVIAPISSSRAKKASMWGRFDLSAGLTNKSPIE